MADIQSRILSALKGHRRGLTIKDLTKRIGTGKNDKHVLREALASLESRFEVITNDGRYISADALGLESAEIVKVTNTFGFARLLGKMADDIFIPGRYLKGSMPGDNVLIKQTRGTGSLSEGEVHAIVKTSDKPFSGVVSVGPDGMFVTPDRQARFPIRLDTSSATQVHGGEKVLATLVKRGERHSWHVARILEVFGDSNSAQACCRSILAENGISSDFSLETMEQARAIASGEGIHPNEIAVRMDLRNETIFTIDGSDTKDIDDAISLKRLSSGWELGVHIADVSYYVTHKSPLDEEAFARGTSVYYAGSVVPMLPKELSNGICSLNPGEDRLAFSAIIRLDENATLTDFSFKKTVIRSRIQGVYSEINSLYDGNASAEISQKYAGFEDTLEDMRVLAEKLSKNRQNRGGMELETVESKITVGADGRAENVYARERGISERIIEEFMLVANEAAATLAIDLGLPFIFRVHDDPSPDKLYSLYEILDTLGIKHNPHRAEVTPADIAIILDSSDNSELGEIINSLVLRSMAKARYMPINTGHFGLALKNYTHFTSPIRRYPDLFIHRVLSSHITGMRRDNIEKRFRSFSSEAAMRSSEREMAAVAAERACEDCYKAEYMERFIGEVFDGVIASVTAFGVYIRLENTVEGLVRLIDFPAGEWGLDGIIAFTDRLSGKKIILGDKVKVKIAGVNVSAGQIDMVFM